MAHGPEGTERKRARDEAAFGFVIFSSAILENITEPYFASWKMGDKVVNKYIGSPRKMTREAATEKAWRLKAEALGI